MKSQPPDVRIKLLEQLIFNPTDGCDARVSYETLLDALDAVVNDLQSSSLRRERQVSDFLERFRPFMQRVAELRVRKSDFEHLATIGKGAFGEVRLVRQKGTGTIYAMKSLCKWHMLEKLDIACFREERNVLVKANSPWITYLHFAFQDASSLYLIMDYYPGGDLMTRISKSDDQLPEDITKFYIAEIVIALDYLHSLRFVHRDIKPENVLIGGDGHICLADFGSCLKMEADGLVRAKASVGTPDYISPEVLLTYESGGGRYGKECDWWSLGISMYEMLFGNAPFYAESLAETYGKIMSHKERFAFPTDEFEVSNAAKDLMSRLICDRAERFGKGGLGDFKEDPFFSGINWESIRDQVPPFVPEIESPTDTSNFPDELEDYRIIGQPPQLGNATFCGRHLPFIGFTFTRNSRLSENGINLTQEAQREKLTEPQKPEPKPRRRARDDRLDDGEHAPDERLAKLQNELNSIKDAYNFQTRELAKSTTKSEELARYNKKLESDMLLMQSERERVLTEKRRAESSLKLMRIKLENQATDLASRQSLQSEVRSLTLRLEHSESESSNLKENLEELRQDGKRTQVDCNRIEQLQNELSKIQNSDHDGRQLLHQKEAQIEHMKSQLTAFEQRLQNFEENENSQEQKITSLEHINHDLNHELDEYKVEDQNREHWESYMKNIVRWVHDEKDARNYLETLALKMGEELEALRNAKQQQVPLYQHLNSIKPPASPDLEKEKWQTLRNKKVKQQQILEIQSTLRDEIQHRESLSNDLADERAHSQQLEHDLMQAQYQIEELQSQITEESQLRNHQTSRSLTRMTLDDRSDDRSASPDHNGSTWSHQSQGKTIISAVTDPSLYNMPNTHVSGRATNKAHLPENHEFVVKTFQEPIQCLQCGTYMLGQYRQGIICEKCDFPCHYHCARNVPKVCPLPKEDMEHRPVGLHTLDIQRGTGTAFQGKFWLPKPQGVKKGWLKFFGAISGNRFFLFSFLEGKTPVISCHAVYCFDLRDELFSAEGVRQNDVIHASKKEIDCIFRVRATAIHRTTSTVKPFLTHSVLVKCINPTERQKWIDYLMKVNKTLKHSLPAPVFRLMEAYDPSLILIKTMITADILSKQRIILGTEDGLYCMDLLRHDFVKMTEKKVYSIKVVTHPNLEMIVLISGNRKTVRIMPMKSLLEPAKFDKNPIKLDETRGAILLSVAAMSKSKSERPRSLSLTVVARKTIFCYEVTFDVNQIPIVKHKQEISLDFIPQFIHQSDNSPFIVVGSTLGFSFYPTTWFVSKGTIYGPAEETRPKHLLSVKQDSALSTLLDNQLLHQPMDALCSVDLGDAHGEFLLCFTKFGIYVNYEGERSRQAEIMWPSQPTDIRCHYPPNSAPPILICFLENSVELFDVFSGQWIQTIACRRLRALNQDGTLSCIESDVRRLTFISTPNESHEENNHVIQLPAQVDPVRGKRQLVKKSKFEFQFKLAEEKIKSLTSKMKDPIQRSKLISGPITNTFQHIEHQSAPRSGPSDSLTQSSPGHSKSRTSSMQSTSSCDLGSPNIDL